MTQLKVKKEWFTYIFLTITTLIFTDFLTKQLSDSKLIIHLFNTITEKNLPSLFSSLQLLFSGFLLWNIYNIDVIKNSSIKIYWKSLAIIFYFLAFDEWITVHDTIGKPFSKLFGETGNLFGWTLLYIIILMIFFIWSLKFLKHLGPKIASLFIISGILFLSGAVGFEVLAKDSMQATLNIQFTPYQLSIIGLIEESLEMLGIFLFNLTLFNYYKNNSTKTLLLSLPYTLCFLIFGILDITITLIFNKNIL